MRTVLMSKIPVRRVALFAEMAWLERRPELGLLCRGARTSGNRITSATVQAALPGLSDAGANNVIAWCERLGLCDKRGGLTALGADVAERDEAPVPEQGVYGMWLAEHPLLGRRALVVERLSATRDARFDAITPLPFEPERGRVFRSVTDERERFLVRDLPTNHGQAGGIRGETRASCSLRWTLDFDGNRESWLLEGQIEDPKDDHALRAIQHKPESKGLELWDLAETWAAGPLQAHGRWQVKERRLAVSFDHVTEDAVDSFQRSFKLERVEVPGLGVYEDVTLEEVPVGPASAADAQRWAMERFGRSLTARPGYRSRVAVREEFAQLTEDTPLERFLPTLPAHGDLLSAAAKDLARLWSLAAPVDLAPAAVSAAELGPLRVGEAAADAPVETPGVVRIPYRGAWSMRRLATQLLGDAAPRRVLLCDRFVRGADNLEALRVFTAALRAVSPGLALEVWTEDAEVDLQQIRAIAGAPPRAYRDVFGRSAPHDRYLVVQPGSGRGFGWQMTNSPLHARAEVSDPGPDTPLRWKDLAAARVSDENLEPALRRWLTGGGR